MSTALTPSPAPSPLRLGTVPDAETLTLAAGVLSGLALRTPLLLPAAGRELWLDVWCVTAFKALSGRHPAPSA